MPRHKIRSRLHRQSARALSKLHRGRLGKGSERTRLPTSISSRSGRERLHELAVSREREMTKRTEDSHLGGPGRQASSPVDSFFKRCKQARRPFAMTGWKPVFE